MLSVADARERAARLVERELRNWAVDGGAQASLELPLHPPTERAAFADSSSAISWARSWDQVEGTLWTIRQWPSMGAQRVPTRLVLYGADAVCRFAGRGAERDWRVLRSRIDAFRERFGASGPATDDGLRRTARAMLDLDDTDFRRLLGVLEWLAHNPQSGQRIRQLPVRGVDTKWIGRHRGLVTALHAVITGMDTLGLVESDVRARIRVLDPSLLPHGFGALRDLESPIEELATVPLTPRRVIVVENLETLLSLADLAATIAVFGRGFGAGARLSGLPWMLHDGVDIAYWGDLDSHGFAILNEFRASFPAARSILMDTVTLEAHMDLCVPEPRATAAELPRLTAAEHEALARLRAEGNVRLEQERIPWSWAERYLG